MTAMVVPCRIVSVDDGVVCRCRVGGSVPDVFGASYISIPSTSTRGPKAPTALNPSHIIASRLYMCQLHADGIALAESSWPLSCAAPSCCAPANAGALLPPPAKPCSPLLSRLLSLHPLLLPAAVARAAAPSAGRRRRRRRARDGSSARGRTRTRARPRSSVSRAGPLSSFSR